MFETENALRELDRATPGYITSEIFAHGDLTVRKNAIEALRSLDPEKHTSRELCEMFRIG